MNIKHGKGMPDKKTIVVPVKQLGIAQFVFVKTKGNGGL